VCVAVEWAGDEYVINAEAIFDLLDQLPTRHGFCKSADASLPD